MTEFADLDKLTEAFQNLIQHGEKMKEVVENEQPKKLDKEAFLEKLRVSPTFRSQLFEQFQFFNATATKDADVLYKAYCDTKKEKVGILSQFIAGNILYISERIGNRVRILYKEYDYEILGNHNFPMSEVFEPMPVTSEELQYWELVACQGCYTFEKKDKPIGTSLSTCRIYPIKKDVFLLNDEIIVHVQDCDIKYDSDREERVVSQFMDLLNNMPPDRPTEIFDEILKSMPGDFQ